MKTEAQKAEARGRLTEGGHAEQKTMVGSLHTGEKKPFVNHKTETHFHLPCTRHTSPRVHSHPGEPQAHTHKHIHICSTLIHVHTSTCPLEAHIIANILRESWEQLHIHMPHVSHMYPEHTAIHSFEYDHALGLSVSQHEHSHTCMRALTHTFPDMSSHRHACRQTHINIQNLGLSCPALNSVTEQRVCFRTKAMELRRSRKTDGG